MNSFQSHIVSINYILSFKGEKVFEMGRQICCNFSKIIKIETLRNRHKNCDSLDDAISSNIRFQFSLSLTPLFIFRLAFNKEQRKFISLTNEVLDELTLTIDYDDVISLRFLLHSLSLSSAACFERIAIGAMLPFEKTFRRSDTNQLDVCTNLCLTDAECMTFAFG